MKPVYATVLLGTAMFLSSITRLKKLGIRSVLVTGDNTVTAERIAGELGIGEVHAEVLPARKVEIVKQLQAQGFNVAFVGDGVNETYLEKEHSS